MSQETHKRLRNAGGTLITLGFMVIVVPIMARGPTSDAISNWQIVTGLIGSAMICVGSLFLPRWTRQDYEEYCRQRWGRVK